MQYNDENVIKLYNDLSYKSLTDMAKEFNIPYDTFKSRVRKLRKKGILSSDRGIVVANSDSGEDITQSKITIMKKDATISQLRKELEESYKSIHDHDKIVSLIHQLNKKEFSTIPEWVNTASNKNESITGIPVLFLSDIHFDEVVNPLEIGGVNEYNREIAINRLNHTFESSVKLLKHYMNKPKYDGFILALGGDCLSGMCHVEFTETNERPILQSVIDLTEIIITGIERLEQEFGKVFVPCVVGNHGRIHQKPRHKHAVYDNYEYLMYHYIAKYFKNNKNITIYIPESKDCLFQVYNKRFLLTHGDGIKGGNGISGILTPLMMALHKKSKNYSSVNKPFDVMMIGHFHTYIHTNSLIVNGSVKGMDEFAYNLNFPFEKPQQALFIVHPKNGITFRMPVLCDEQVYEETDNKVRIIF